VDQFSPWYGVTLLSPLAGVCVCERERKSGERAKRQRERKKERKKERKTETERE
jgi:hypothetical protein